MGLLGLAVPYRIARSTNNTPGNNSKQARTGTDNIINYCNCSSIGI